jgi:hypothetical protein
VLQAIRELETKEEALKGKIAIAPPPTGAVNPFTTWKPLAKTPDNRIALRMILNRTIESFILDTTDKTATLTLKGVTAKINLKWVGQPQQRGTDGQLLERPLDKFYINGKEQPYLDNVVIWQSPENFKDSKLLTLVLMGCVINHIAMKAPHSLPAPPKP